MQRVESRKRANQLLLTTPIPWDILYHIISYMYINNFKYIVILYDHSTLYCIKQGSLQLPLDRGRSPQSVTASRRGRDKRGLRKSAAIPHNRCSYVFRVKVCVIMSIPHHRCSYMLYDLSVAIPHHRCSNMFRLGQHMDRQAVQTVDRRTPAPLTASLHHYYYDYHHYYDCYYY